MIDCKKETNFYLIVVLVLYCAIFSWFIIKYTLYSTLVQPIEKNGNKNCLNELKFCEVSRIYFRQMLKDSASILKNKKVLFLKKNIFQVVVSNYAKIDPTDGVCYHDFQWRFWWYRHCIILFNVNRAFYSKYILKNRFSFSFRFQGFLWNKILILICYSNLLISSLAIKK